MGGEARASGRASRTVEPQADGGDRARLVLTHAPKILVAPLIFDVLVLGVLEDVAHEVGVADDDEGLAPQPQHVDGAVRLGEARKGEPRTREQRWHVAKQRPAVRRRDAGQRSARAPVAPQRGRERDGCKRDQQRQRWQREEPGKRHPRKSATCARRPKHCDRAVKQKTRAVTALPSGHANPPPPPPLEGAACTAEPRHCATSRVSSRHQCSRRVGVLPCCCDTEHAALRRRRQRRVDGEGGGGGSDGGGGGIVRRGDSRPRAAAPLARIC